MKMHSGRKKCAMPLHLVRTAAKTAGTVWLALLVLFGTFHYPTLAGDTGDYEENGIIYSLEQDGAWVKGYTGSPADVVIPALIQGLPVKGVQDSAFKDCTSLTGITLPEGVDTVGMSAFEGCTGLVKASLPDSITILKSSAFKNCSALASVNLPKNITTVSYSLFYGCSSITEMEIPEGVTEIESDAFHFCKFKEIKVPEGVKSIGFYSFRYCSALESIELPDSLQAINECAFEWCRKLKSLVIPANVTRIGSAAFRGCSAMTNLEIRGILKTIPSYCFTSCTSLQSVVLPEGVISIEDHAFSSCSALQKLYIPDSVTTIHSGAFYNSGSTKAYVYKGSYANTYLGSWRSVLVDATDYFAKQDTFLFAKLPETTVCPDENLTVSDLFLFGGAVSEDNLRCTSSDENVIMVAEDGFAIIDNGTCTVTAESNGQRAQAVVRVADEAGGITGRIHFENSSVTADVGQAFRQAPSFEGAMAGNAVVTWTSADEDLAGVDGNGVVHGIAEGTTTITAHCGTYTASYEITFVRSVKLVDILDEDMTMDAESQFRLLYRIFPYYSPGEAVFESSNPSVISVDNQGILTALEAGTAVITLRKGDCADSITVTVESHLKGLTLNYRTLRLRTGKRADLGFTTRPSNTTDEYEVEWKTSNPAVVTVEDGIVTGVGKGKATVSVTAGAFSVSCPVTVLDLTGISLSESDVTVTEGNAILLSASLRPAVTEDTDDYEIVWDSDNSTVAEVDVNGRVKACAAGTADVTAVAANGVAAVCRITVVHDPEKTVIENEVKATCTQDGSYDEVVYCKVCHAVISRETVSVPASGHIPGETVIEKEVRPTDETAGSYDEVLYCSVCGEELSRETVIVPKIEKGTFRENLKEAGKILMTVKISKDGSDVMPSEKWVTQTAVDTLQDAIKEAQAIADRKDAAQSEVDAAVLALQKAVEAFEETQQPGRKPAKTVPTELILNKTDIKELATKSSVQLKVVKFKPDDTTEKGITWKSSDPKIATVDANGKVTALKYGKVMITATSKANPEARATCQIRTRLYDALSTNVDKEMFKAIYWAVDNDISGMPVYFKTKESMTRGQFVHFLWNLAGKPKVNTKKIKNPFADVNSKTAHYKQILWAVDKGLIAGYKEKGKQVFKPEGTLTRNNVATILWKYSGSPKVSKVKKPFADVAKSAAVSWGKSKGIFRADKNGKFRPKADCIRGDFAVFLYRYNNTYKIIK